MCGLLSYNCRMILIEKHFIESLGKSSFSLLTQIISYIQEVSFERTAQIFFPGALPDLELLILVIKYSLLSRYVSEILDC